MEILSIINSMFSYIKIMLKNVLIQGLNLPTLLFFLLFSVGIYFLLLRGTKSWVKDTLADYVSKDSEGDKLFLRTGLKIKANKYLIFLYLASLLIILWSGIISVKSASPKLMVIGILIAILIVYFLEPKEKILGTLKSPFMYALNLITNKRRDNFDKELYNSVVTLKNLAITEIEQNLSADLIFEKLTENSKRLKPIYEEMLNKYRTGDISGCFTYFSDSIGTKNGKAFSLLLEKIDKIHPNELKASVNSLQEVMQEERFTKGMELAEKNGNLTYAMASAVCFISILNFAVVVVMMDALNMMTSLF